LKDLYLSGNKVGSLSISLIAEKTSSRGKSTVLEVTTLTMNF